MQSFVSRHQHQIQGTLSGFDRLRFSGSLLQLCYVDGLGGFLHRAGVLLKEFGEYVLELSRQIKRNTVEIGASHSPVLPWVCQEPRQQGGCDSHASRKMRFADR